MKDLFETLSTVSPQDIVIIINLKNRLKDFPNPRLLKSILLAAAFKKKLPETIFYDPKLFEICDPLVLALQKFNNEFFPLEIGEVTINEVHGKDIVGYVDGDERLKILLQLFGDSKDKTIFPQLLTKLEEFIKTYDQFVDHGEVVCSLFAFYPPLLMVIETANANLEANSEAKVDSIALPENKNIRLVVDIYKSLFYQDVLQKIKFLGMIDSELQLMLGALAASAVQLNCEAEEKNISAATVLSVHALCLSWQESLYNNEKDVAERVDDFCKQFSAQSKRVFDCQDKIEANLSVFFANIKKIIDANSKLLQPQDSWGLYDLANLAIKPALQLYGMFSRLPFMYRVPQVTDSPGVVTSASPMSCRKSSIEK